MRLFLPNGMLRRADVDLSDLTGSVPTGDRYWDPDEVDVLVYPLDPEPSPDEQAAIRHRLMTADDTDEARLSNLLALRAAATTPFEVMWLDTELGKYGL